MKKLDCCPYCRSHKLTCSLYKSKIKKKVKKTSLEQQKRKNKMKKVKRKIREYDRLKKALKTKYPTMILCHKNGVISNSDDIETIRRYGFNILPLKLYKYYLKYFKQLSFTSYDKAKHDIIITYAGFKEANYILDLLDNEYYYTYESEDELSDDESDDNYIFGVPDYVNSYGNSDESEEENVNESSDDEDYHSITREEFLASMNSRSARREREWREQAVEEMENILDDMIDFGF